MAKISNGEVMTENREKTGKQSLKIEENKWTKIAEKITKIGKNENESKNRQKLRESRWKKKLEGNDKKK